MQKNSSITIRSRKPANFIDRTGHIYGKLVVLQYAGSNHSYQTQWKCQCECGNTPTVFGCNLTKGNTTSCGCYGQARRLVRAKTHGKRHTPIYNIWCKMISRCTKPTDKAYHHYGGRGITVCERWQRFQCFYDDMGDRPENLSLDRIDNNGGYWCVQCGECKQKSWPSNCRWATRSEQMTNRRSTRYLTYKGQTASISQWAQTTGIRRLTITRRLELGWSVVEALSVPVLANDASRKKHRWRLNSSE